MKAAVILILFLLFTTLLSLQALPTTTWSGVLEATFKDTCKYRRAIVIKEQSGSVLSGYQVKIVLDSSFFNFSHINPDGSDFRFYYSNGTSIPYWIETLDTANGYAVIWIKVDLGALENLTIYMYYGKPDATPQSNGEEVFIFFDDFNTLDSNKWTIVRGTPTVSNGRLIIDADDEAIRTTVTFSDNCRIMLRTDPNTEGFIFCWHADTNVDINPGGTWSGNCYLTAIAEGIASGITVLVDGSGSGVATGTITNPAGFFIFEVSNLNGNRSTWVNGELSASGTDTTFTSGYIHIEGEDTSREGAPYGEIDWIAVRKYVEPEPNVTIGPEEELSGTEIINIQFEYYTILEDGKYVTYYNASLDVSRYSNGTLELPFSNFEIINITGADYTVSGNKIYLNFTSSTLYIEFKAEREEDCYFFYISYDNGTSINQWYLIDYGQGFVNKSESSFWIEKSLISDIITLKISDDVLRHFRKRPAIYVRYPDTTKDYALIVFSIVDFSGEFSSGSYLIIKDREGRVIEEEPVTADMQALAFLQQYGSYTLSIEKDGIVRSIGLVIIDTSSKTVYIGTSFTPQASVWESVKLDYYIQDNTLYVSFKELNNKECTLTVRLLYSNSTVIYQNTLSGYDISVAITSLNLSETLILNIVLEHPDKGTVNITRTLGMSIKYTSRFEEIGSYIDEIFNFLNLPAPLNSIPGRTWLALFFIVFTAMIFTVVSAGIGAVVTVILSAFFTYIGWLPLSWTIVMVSVSLAIIYALTRSQYGY